MILITLAQEGSKALCLKTLLTDLPRSYLDVEVAPLI